VSSADATHKTPPPSTISADDVNRLIAEHADMVIVDVRSPEIFEKQGWTTFPSARVITLEQLEDRLDELPRDKLIITTCMQGFRSAPAMELLKKHGFARVEMARFDEYLAKGHPVVAVERPAQ
jgi:rhodanese-related sulfurtransferase